MSATWALLVPLVVCHIYPILHDLVSFHWYVHISGSSLLFQPFSKVGRAADLLPCSGSGYHCAAELLGIFGQTYWFGGVGGYAQQLCRVTNFLSYLCSVAKTYCWLGTQAGKNRTISDQVGPLVGLCRWAEPLIGISIQAPQPARI